MILIIASMAFLWLVICFIKWVEDINRAWNLPAKSKHFKMFARISNAYNGAWDSKWGQDFIISLIVTLFATAVMAGVTGMIIGLITSFGISVYLWLRQILEGKQSKKEN